MSSAAILSWNKTSRAQKAILLAKATKRCDTSCREGVTLRNVEKIPCNVAKRVAESRTNFTLLFATIAATKKLREMSVAGYVTTGNISCNLCCNKIARQVAREIA